MAKKTDAAEPDVPQEIAKTYQVITVVEALPSDADDYNNDMKGRDETSTRPGSVRTILVPYDAPAPTEKPVLTAAEASAEMPTIP